MLLFCWLVGSTPAQTPRRESLPTNARVTMDPASKLANFTSLGEWNNLGDAEGWTLAGISGATVSGGTLDGTGNAAVARISKLGLRNGPDLDLGFNDFLDARVQLPANFAGDLQLCYGSTFAPGIDAARVLTVPNVRIPKDGVAHVYRFDLGLEVPWRGSLTDLCVEFTNATNVMFAVDYVRVGDPAADLYRPRITAECPAADGKTPAKASFGPNQKVYSHGVQALPLPLERCCGGTSLSGPRTCPTAPCATPRKSGSFT